MWTAIFTGIIAAGAGIALIQLRDARRSRNAATASAIAQRWDSDELIAARKQILKIVGGFQPEEAIQRLTAAVMETKQTQGENAYYVYSRYLNFFEEIGVTCRHRSAIKMVEAVLGTTIQDNWRMWRVVIGQVWGEQSKVCENFGRLAYKLERRGARRTWREARIKFE
jgi:hypothetical protein